MFHMAVMKIKFPLSREAFLANTGTGYTVHDVFMIPDVTGRIALGMSMYCNLNATEY